MKTIWAALFLAGLLVTPARAETVTYLHTDLLGSVVLETDQNRNVVARYEYEPYGLPRQAIADGPGYTGHVHDVGSGLVYMQQRYYDPEVGQFLSIDPVGVDLATGASFNRYWYGNNNPYRYVDPDGRVPVLVVAAVFAWRAYSAYDTATSAAENISTLADADASLGDKTMAGLELAASVLGGKAGRESVGVADKLGDGARSGRSANKVRPDERAEGPHSTFKRDASGDVTNTATYEPNARNLSGFQETKRVDMVGKSHRNPDGTVVPTPHVKEAGTKAVRPIRPDEKPSKSK